MSPSTSIQGLFKYIKGTLGVFWMEWVDIQITGFSADRFPPHSIWKQTRAFNEDYSAHLLDCDALGAVRQEVNLLSFTENTPYIQVVIRARPPRVKRQAKYSLRNTDR